MATNWCGRGVGPLLEAHTASWKANTCCSRHRAGAIVQVHTSRTPPHSPAGRRAWHQGTTCCSACRSAALRPGVATKQRQKSTAAGMLCRAAATAPMTASSSDLTVKRRQPGAVRQRLGAHSKWALYASLTVACKCPQNQRTLTGPLHLRWWRRSQMQAAQPNCSAALAGACTASRSAPPLGRRSGAEWPAAAHP